ncbi:hypothetical protein ElyMa_006842100 [Elysia marginata]|uniref:Uncharacterized protein n=1 Tax=Elysia marginata TaxID=1093978 RepID=A0AAV4J947_9GAST|nr:hypothetical protein ElyMa_006842100 [Elysia marginata]
MREQHLSDKSSRTFAQARGGDREWLFSAPHVFDGQFLQFPTEDVLTSTCREKDRFIRCSNSYVPTCHDDFYVRDIITTAHYFLDWLCRPSGRVVAMHFNHIRCMNVGLWWIAIGDCVNSYFDTAEQNKATACDPMTVAKLHGCVTKSSYNLCGTWFATYITNTWPLLAREFVGAFDCDCTSMPKLGHVVIGE